MSIKQLIQAHDRTIIHCTPFDSVRQAAAQLAEERIGALPVIDGGKVVGIFSERDFLYCVARDGASVLDKTVGDVMTAPAITIDPSIDAIEALSLMTRRRVRHLPVVESGRMIAFVSIGDLVKYRMDLIENEAKAMRDYITTA